jgi:hypothetical protein
MSNLRLLDATGLGTYSSGTHMELDLRGLSGELRQQLTQQGIVPTTDVFAMDTYTFMLGDRMYSVTVIYPVDGSQPADPYRLARLLYDRSLGNG